MRDTQANQARYRDKHRDRIKAYAATYCRSEVGKSSIKRWRAHRRVWLEEYKLVRGCVDCGYRDHPAALDFDHRPDEVKGFTISEKKEVYSQERLLVEMAKCDIRCANCHRIKTRQRFDE
jgi:hypothetical protein